MNFIKMEDSSESKTIKMNQLNFPSGNVIFTDGSFNSYLQANTQDFWLTATNELNSGKYKNQEKEPNRKERRKIEREKKKRKNETRKRR